MKILLAFCICATVAGIAIALDSCTSAVCDITKECACASKVSPIDTATTPQLVLLTFNDAVAKDIYDDYYTKLLLNRKNPDKNPISATFFVSHEYTNYECVNKLYNYGFEIGSHGISKNTPEYWDKLSEANLTKEFKGQKTILSKFANVPAADIKGARTPFFHVIGESTFNAYVAAGISYDSSWVALYNDKLFPYTLDFKSDQPCLVGQCPTNKSYPKFWINAVNNIAGNMSEECNVLEACGIDGTTAELKTWLITEFNRTYNGNRAPFKLIIPTSWFRLIPASFPAVVQFLDHLATLKDTFIVSESQAIEWRKKVVTFDKFDSAIPARKAACKPLLCILDKSPEQTRYMTICGDACPKKYPSVENPEGN